MARLLWAGFVVIAFLGLATRSGLAEGNPCHPWIPEDQVAQAKEMKNPFSATHEVIARGRAIFEGKGTCSTCHGLDGKGTGEGEAVPLSSLQTIHLADPALQACMSDGDMFWIIKNGVSGTGMIPFFLTGILTEDEIWKVIHYIRTFTE